MVEMLSMEDLDKDNLARKKIPVSFWKNDIDGFVEINLELRRIGPLEFQSVITSQELDNISKIISVSEKDTFTKVELIELIVSASENDSMKELDIVARLLERACITPKLPKEYWLKFLDRMPNIKAILDLSTFLTTFSFVSEAEMNDIKN